MKQDGQTMDIFFMLKTQDADRRNERGVGLILDEDMKECVLGFCHLSERIHVLKLKGKSFYISIVVYAPKAQSTEKEIKKNLLYARQSQGSMQITRSYNCCVRPECQNRQVERL